MFVYILNVHICMYIEMCPYIYTDNDDTKYRRKIKIKHKRKYCKRNAM